MTKLLSATLLLCWLSSPAAEITTIAGPEGVDNPFGVIVGLDGDVYFCDTSHHQIKRIHRRSGKVSTIVGTGKKGYSGDGGAPLAADLNEPYEIRFHPDGDLYWVEMQNHIVRKLDARSQTIATVAGTGEPGVSGDGGPATAAQLHRPHSISFDSTGEYLYICDIKNHRIRRVELSTGIISTWCGNGKAHPTPAGSVASPDTPLKGPRALDLAPDGDLWLALREGNALYRISMPAGNLQHIAGTGKRGYHSAPTPALESKLSGPKGVALSPDGQRVYLADTESHTVRAVDLSTEPHMLHSIVGDGQRGDGPDQGDPAACRMARLHGIGTDPITADLYIGDSETDKIRKVTRLPGSIEWRALQSYATDDFQIEGIKCRVARPEQARAGKPWIWRCRFWGAFPGLDEALLADGWHVCWTDVANLFGAPEAMQRFDRFYSEVRDRYDLAEKPVMEGFSRGGLPALNWAIANPEKVTGVYLDAAVADIRSWPKNKSAKLFQTALTAYDLSDENLWQGPLDNLKPLAQAEVPIWIVAGGSDRVVPYSENTGILEKRYTALGGPIKAIVKAACDHHPHGLYGPANNRLVGWLNEAFEAKQ